MPISNAIKESDKMCRKQLFEKIHALESCKERASLELIRHKDYQESLERYISDLEMKIAKLRSEISKTASSMLRRNKNVH